MTENVIKALPEVFKDKLCTMKGASRDTTNNECMCESILQVVRFDRMPNEYAKGKGWPGVPQSNDALYIDNAGKWFFIEFKNGGVHKDEIYKKIYDSLIILLESELIPDFNFSRNNIDYILVYNGKKQGKAQESTSRTETYNYFHRQAKEEEKLFGIDKFEKYLFNKTHTYTKEQFQAKFIDLKEKEEAIYVQ